MAYCTNTQVKAIVDTDMSDAEVTELITETDAYLDTILDTGTLSATILQMLSRHYTAYTVMLKDPNARTIGSYSENRSDTMDLMEAKFDRLVLRVSGGIAFTAAGESLY